MLMGLCLAFHDRLNFVSVHRSLADELKSALPGRAGGKQSLESQVEAIMRAKATKLAQYSALPLVSLSPFTLHSQLPGGHSQLPGAEEPDGRYSYSWDLGLIHDITGVQADRQVIIAGQSAVGGRYGGSDVPEG